MANLLWQFSDCMDVPCFFFLCSSLEQFKEFDDEPLCVAMHPDGHSILAGFATEVWLMKIFNDKISTVQTFAISNCTEVGLHYRDLSVKKVLSGWRAVFRYGTWNFWHIRSLKSWILHLQFNQTCTIRLLQMYIIEILRRLERGFFLMWSNADRLLLSLDRLY